ncbi:uncharacterized protein ISCGN_031435 [Ixodes scapularis]
MKRYSSECPNPVPRPHASTKKFKILIGSSYGTLVTKKRMVLPMRKVKNCELKRCSKQEENCFFSQVNAVWAGHNFQVAVALIFSTMPPGWHDWQRSKDGSFSLGCVMLCTE